MPTLSRASSAIVLAILFTTIAIVGGCDPCPWGVTITKGYEFDAESGGKVVAPELQFEQEFPRQSVDHCPLHELTEHLINVEACMHSPPDCTNPCFAQATDGSQVEVAIALKNLPQTEPVALPDPRVRIEIKRQGAPFTSQPLMTANVVRGVLAWTNTADNFDATYSFDILLPDGRMVSIQNGRYAKLKGHTDKICGG